MQTHSVFKHFRCERCNKSFALKSYLNKHYESACFKDGSSPDSDAPGSPSSGGSVAGGLMIDSDDGHVTTSNTRSTKVGK